MEFATVTHVAESEAAQALYQACGFKPWYPEEGFAKQIALE
jgi:hypothetical protein